MRVTLHRALTQCKRVKAELTKEINDATFIVMRSEAHDRFAGRPVEDIERGICVRSGHVVSLIGKLGKLCTYISDINQGVQDYIWNIHAGLNDEGAVEYSIRAAEETLLYRQKLVEALSEQLTEVKAMVSSNDMNVKAIDPLGLEELIARIKEKNKALADEILLMKEIQSKQERFFEYCQEQAKITEKETEEFKSEKFKKYYEALEAKRLREMKAKIWNYDRSKCAIQYNGNQEPPFQTVDLKPHYQKGIRLKYTDFLEFYVEERQEKEDGEILFNGVHVLIKKEANYEKIERGWKYTESGWRRWMEVVNIFDMILDCSICRLVINSHEQADVPWRYADWCEKVYTDYGENGKHKNYGFMIANEVNGAEEAFINDDGNLVIHIA